MFKGLRGIGAVLTTTVGLMITTVVTTVFTTALTGCDLSSEPLAALVRITEPDRGDTLRLGQPFALKASVETDGPADSLIVTLHPRRSGTQSIRQFDLTVPPELRAGTGVLSAEIDTNLILVALPDPEAHEYTISVKAYVAGRVSGGIGGTEVYVE